MLIRSNIPISRLTALIRLFANYPLLSADLNCLSISKNNTLGVYEDFTIMVESTDFDLLQKVMDVCKDGEGE
jgi:hypothetical protein